MVQNDKKLCLLHFISQEPCIIWLSFMVLIYKMMISSGVFSSFLKFWFSIFWVHGGVHISGTIYHMIVIYGGNVLNDNISRCFFLFRNFDFPGCQGAEEAKNGPKWQKFWFVSSFISRTIYHMIFIYVTDVCIKR